MKHLVYFLPKVNYCGCTSRDINKRLWEHRSYFNRDTTGFEILGEFSTRREALDFEKKYQIENNVGGYIFTDEWRKIQSDKAKKRVPSSVLRKKVIELASGTIYDSVRQCEKQFGKSTGNLSKHLKGHPQHKTFHGLKFEYYDEAKHGSTRID